MCVCVGVQTAVVLIGEEEMHLVAMPSKEKRFPCFWCYSIPRGLYDSCLRMLNLRCLSIVFDLDETLIVANTLKSFEDRIEMLRSWINQEIDPVKVASMTAEMKRYVDDRALLKQYADNDYITENGKVLNTQPEEVVPLSDTHERVVRPVIRLQDRNIVLTRINPEVSKIFCAPNDATPQLVIVSVLSYLDCVSSVVMVIFQLIVIEYSKL